MSLDVNMILNSPEMMLKLAMGHDPAPILQELQGASGGSIVADQFPNTPYSDMTQPPPKTPAPLDPRAAMLLNSMMPKTPEPKFIGGAAPRQPVPVNLQIPDMAAMIKMLQERQQQSSAVPPAPTLASLLQGR